jgi:hypothetical protein
MLGTNVDAFNERSILVTNVGPFVNDLSERCSRGRVGFSKNDRLMYGANVLLVCVTNVLPFYWCECVGVEARIGSES